MLTMKILVFQYSPPSTPETCGNRITYAVNDETRKAISIAYAVLIAFFSLVIGLGFLIFGTKLQIQFRNTAKALNKSSAASTKVKFLWSKGIILFGCSSQHRIPKNDFSPVNAYRSSGSRW
jgi:hypothetical protein